MIFRTLLTLVNLSTFAAAIAVLLVFPQYSAYAFYFLVGWMVASLVLFYQPWASRPIGAGAPAPGPGPAAAPAFPSAPAPVAGAPAPPPLDFCIYCAAPLAVGSTKCAACGHDRGTF